MIEPPRLPHGWRAISVDIDWENDIVMLRGRCVRDKHTIMGTGKTMPEALDDLRRLIGIIEKAYTR